MSLYMSKPKPIVFPSRRFAAASDDEAMGRHQRNVKE